MCVFNLVDPDFVCIVSISESESVEILGCSFRDNIAQFSGGALLVGQTKRTDVMRCNFENNLSRGSGGSIEFQLDFSFSRSGDVALVSESNFTNSFSRLFGGAIFSEFPGNVTVERSTFTSCISDGGAACTTLKASPYI